MAKGRLISMNFWSDGKVEDDFTPEDKYGYLWCLTNPHTNLCGCYEISTKQIAHELGYNTDTVERLLLRLDGTHNVIRYNASTKELLVLNWYRYNWSASEKLDKPLLSEIRAIKCDRFRAYLADRYNERESVQIPYECWDEARPQAPEADAPRRKRKVKDSAQAPPEKKLRHKRGKYGWVRLTDEEMERLTQDLGAEELARCIAYVDESAQATNNRNGWKDWNLVIRKCGRGQWGIERSPGGGPRPSASQGAAEDLRALHELFDRE